MSLKESLDTLENNFNTLEQSRKDIIGALREKEVEAADTLKISEIDEKIELIDTNEGTILRVNAKGFEGKTVTATLGDTVLSGKIENGICDFLIKENGLWKITVDSETVEIEVSNIVEADIRKNVYLPYGLDFNNAIKKINQDVKEIIFTYDNPPSGKTLTNFGATETSISISNNDIVGWADGDTIYISSKGNKFIANANCNSMFSGLSCLESIDLSLIDTSNVTSMQQFVRNCTNLKSIELSNNDLTKVNSINYFFYETNLETYNLTCFEDSPLNSINNLFGYCLNLKYVDLSPINKESITSLYYVFSGCSSLQDIDLSKFNKPKLTNLEYAFQTCKSLEKIDLSFLDLENVTSLRSCFYGCSNLKEINFGNVNLNISDSYGAYDTFFNCVNLEKIYSNNWNISSTLGGTFNSCIKLPNYSSGRINPSYCKLISENGYFTPVNEIEDDNSIYNTAYLCSGNQFRVQINNLNSKCTSIIFTDELPPETASTINLGVNSNSATTAPNNSSIVAWNDDNTIYVSGKGAYILANVNSSQMFYNFSSLRSVNFKMMKTYNTTNMSQMFYNCSSLKSADLSSFNTQSLEDMSSIFRSCTNLEEIYLSFKAPYLKNMSYAFADCTNLEKINLSFFESSSLENLSYTFRNCNNLKEINLSGFNTALVTDMRYMFDGCSSLITLNLNNFNTSNVNRFDNMFRNCTKLEEIYLSNFDTSNATSMASMFDGCSSLRFLNLRNFSIQNLTLTTSSSITGLYSTFSGCAKLQYILAQDWSKEKDLSAEKYTFNGCYSLPNWTSSKISGDYCKPISEGGYFTPPIE